MYSFIVRIVLFLTAFSFLTPSSFAVSSDDKTTPLKKLFNVSEIDFDKKIAGHTATLLSDGRVLIIGGRDEAGPLSDIFIYDASTNQLKDASVKLINSRFDHTATILTDNKILIAGGSDSRGAISSLEVYDPASDTISALSNTLSIQRAGHTATLLSDGRVLITGGIDSSGASLDSAEAYDPKAQTISLLSQKMTTSRSNHTATLLSDGRVVIIGGKQNDVALNSAEIFNPASEDFTSLSGQFKKGRFGHTATLLPDGRILIAFGAGYEEEDDEDNDDEDKDKKTKKDEEVSKIKPYNSGYLYDAEADSFTKVSGKIGDKRYDHTAILLSDARIMIIGGTGKEQEKEEEKEKDKKDKDKGGEDGDGETEGIILTPVTEDKVIPSISNISISNNAPDTQKGPETIAYIRFSEPIRVTTLSSDTLILKKEDGTKTEGIISQSESGLLAFFTPKNNLSGGKAYTIELTNGITDTSGNPITAYTNKFTVPNPVPSITSLSPSAAKANTAFTLTITGTGFVEASKIKIGGYEIAATYIKETEIKGEVASSIIKQAGNYPVVIENPSPGGGTSNSINLEIKNILDIQIASPSDNSYVTTPYITVEGAYSSTYQLSSIKIWGLDAEIIGNSFKSSPIVLAPGENTITATAQDANGNQAIASVRATLIEASPPSGGEIRGYIYGIAYDAKTKAPLSNAEIIAKGQTYKVNTDANGRYTLPVPEEGGYDLYIEKAGYVTAKRDVYVMNGGKAAADSAYLVPFDTKAATIMASEGGRLTDTTGMVEVVIPAGALPYDMSISATYIQDEESFPIPIPYGDNYIAGVQFAPEYITFKSSVTVRIKNTIGFPAGTQLPFAYAAHDVEDSNEGFYDPGMGVVTADGQYIEYQLPHFSCMVSTSPGPSDNPPQTDSDDDDDEEECETGSCSVGVTTGNLLIDYFLPSYKSLGQENGLALLYNSSTVYNHIPVSIRSKPRSGSSTPISTTFSASTSAGASDITAHFKGTDQEQRFRALMEEIYANSITTGIYYSSISVSQKFKGAYYSTSSFGGSSSSSSSSSSSTGSLVASISVTVPPKPAASKTRTIQRVPIVNQINSPFGAGWTLSGYERLYINPDGNILLTDGGNSSIFIQNYAPQPLATGFMTPTGIAVDSSDKVYAADGTNGSIFTISSEGNVNLFAKIVSCNAIRGVTIGSDNNLYIATGYHRQIEKVITSTGETSFYTPQLNVGHMEDIVFDSKGNLYVVDGGYGRVLKIAPDKTITTFASGFINPISITVDKDDNLYVTNNNNTRSEVRCGVSWISKIDPAGNVSTYASDLNAPMGLTIDNSGNIYVIDTACNDSRLPHYIYRITPGGLKEKLSNKNIGSGYAFGLSYDIAINSKGDLFVTSTLAGAVMGIRLNNTYASSEGDYSVLTKESDGAFTRKLKDGTAIKYSSNGLMTSKTDRNGNTYTYIHDGDGKLTAITDPLNQTTTLNYTSGLLSSITDPFGRQTTFNHDGNRNLTSITGPDGSITYYGYDSRRLLTTKTLSGSKTYQYTYDQYGKIKTTQAPTGEARQYLPAAVQKLINDLSAGTGTETNLAEAILASDIKSQVTDGKGYTRTIKTDQTGVAEKTDALGRTTAYTRDTNGNATEIALPDGNKIAMTYDEKGNLLSRTDQLGNKTTYTYESTHNRVASVKEPRGNTSNFSYDTNGNLTNIKDGLNNATGITYSSKGLIISVTDAQNNITQYTYNALYQLESITDALGNITRFRYDSRGNITSITDAKGSITTYEYDILDRLIKVTDPQGGITTYTYTNPANCDCGKENPNGNITSITDANGNATTFEYNQIGQLTKITDPLKNIKAYNYDMNRNLISITDAKGNTINYDYDAANRLIKKTMPEGAADYTYDLIDNLTTAQNPDITYNLVYDAGGRNTSITSSLGKTLNYGYDQNGNRTNISGDAGRDYAYDNLNRVYRMGKLASYTYDSLGRRTKVSIPYSDTYTYTNNYTYDQLSRLTNLSGVNAINYTYDEIGNRTSSISRAHITSSFSITAASDITTDIPNVEIAGAIDNPDGSAVQINNSPVAINTDNTFAAPLSLSIGNNTISIKLTDALGGEASKDIGITLNSPNINAPSTIKVQSSNIKIAGKIDNPAGYTIKINNNNIQISTDGQFESVQNLQWGDNNINIEVANPYGQSAAKQIIVLYDAPYNLHADYIAVHPVTYEVYGIDLAFSDPPQIMRIKTDGTINTIHIFQQGYYPYIIAFNPNGELYASGWDTSTSSDSILKINNDGTATTIATGITVLSMAIDGNNNIYAAGGANGDTIYKITPDGQTTAIAALSTGIGGITLDAQGNIYASTYNYGIDGAIYKIAQDGTQTTITQRSNIIEIGSIAADNNGNIYTIERGPGAINECTAYRVLKISNTGAVNTIIEECDNLYYTSPGGGIGIDANKNIIILSGYGARIMKITQTGLIGEYIQGQSGQEIVTVEINAVDLSLKLKVPVNIKAARYIYGTKTYTYDSTNRLTSVMRGVLEEDRFSYDAVGNRLTDIAGSGYTYNNGNELLTIANSVQPSAFSYDANGNMISKTDNCGTTSYQFDTENRLVVINGYKPDCSSLTAIYKYDPFGRRIEKNVTDTVNGTRTTRYVYDREDILFELDASGNIITEYLHGHGIDEPIAMIRGGQTYYYHADGLGSIIAITDSNGNVVQKYEYDSFGNISYQQDASFKQPYTYTGREYDEESGLYYYRARYYDSKIGRFIARDPLGFVDGFNLYMYVENNPVNFIDPFGLVTWPTDYRTVTGEFGGTRNHSGVDIRNPKDSPVYATDSGTVVNVYYNNRGGNQIIVKNDDGSISGYAHTKSDVKPGDRVEEGQKIGNSDGSGQGTAPHLHHTYRECPTCKKSDPMEHLKDAKDPKKPCK